jgi:site-specific DNA-cytosine methylase
MKPRAPQVRLLLGDDEVFIDGFAGGGGTSTGIEKALGRSPDIAINHDAEALAMHAVNHPETRHIKSNIKTVNWHRHAREGAAVRRRVVLARLHVPLEGPRR